MLEIENEFYAFGVILGVAVVFGLIGTLLRQPLLVAFIAVGIAVGPAWLDVASSNEQIELLASIGISLLLFVVGLKLDLAVIRTMGRAALAAGAGQLLVTTALGLVLSLALGFGGVESLYIAMALTFSSTIVIVKVLSDKREIDSLHGRLSVGILIVQDLAVVITIIAVSAVGSGEEADPLREAGLVVLKGIGMLAAVAVLMRFVIPRVLPILARSPELLVLSAIAWAVALAAVGDALGFSKEVGAFLAGVSLASTPFREAISGRLTSLRDFLLLFFFVELGAELDFDHASDQVVPAIVLSTFVLVANPLIVIGVLGAMGYRKRTSFLTGLTMAQVSEFSLVFAALGVSLGHIESDVLGLIALVAIVTIALSSYLILYSHQIYEHISRLLAPFERRMVHPEDIEGDIPRQCDVILFGLGRFGSAIAAGLRARGDQVLGIDFDPEVVRLWRRHDWPVHYGDAEDPEFVQHLPLSGARWVVCSAPGIATGMAVMEALRAHNYAGRIAVTAHNDAEACRLTGLHPDVVLRPFDDAAVRAVEELT